ncbi:hypothetical protein KY345_06920 [Candidatus Woesearchaeota archaeon]|nr:hypothetical protein [Candidatus Woesearchaeota archaeon]
MEALCAELELEEAVEKAYSSDIDMNFGAFIKENAASAEEEGRLKSIYSSILFLSEYQRLRNEGELVSLHDPTIKNYMNFCQYFPETRFDERGIDKEKLSYDWYRINNRYDDRLGMFVNTHNLGKIETVGELGLGILRENS